MNHEEQLNRMTPAAKKVSLGSLIEEMIENFNALLAKLDTDTGVNSTDYVSTLRVRPLSER